MADRTVSVRLRAQVGDFVAEMNIAGKAVDDFGKKVDGTSRKTTDSFTRTGREVERSATLMRSELASLIATAVALSPPVAAAGVAFAAFGAVAAPSIVKVVTAQKDLAAGWATLDDTQKATSASLNGLIDQYKSLAASYEPQALALFNSALGDTEVLMQRARPLIDAGAVGVQHFTGVIDDFVTGGTMTGFLNFAARTTPQAFDQLGTTFTETGTLALHLIQDLTPMGMTLLSTANSGLRLLNMVEQLDPRLAELGVAALALRAPTRALGNLWTNNASKLSKLAKEGSTAESFLGKLGKTVGAVPNLYIGAALAVGYVVTRLATMKDSTDNLIASLKVENNAFGNNIAGHRAMTASLSQYITQAKAAEAAALADGVAENAAQSTITRYGEKIKKLTGQRKDELASIRNITAGQNDLAARYNITAQQANQLATAAGVDLSKGITGSGDAAKAAQAKIRAYYDVVQQAQNPTFVISQSLLAAGNNALALKDRMAALANAFNALAGPEITAFDATTKTADAFAQLDAALKKSHGSMSLTSAAGRAARAAFANLFATVEQNIQAQYQFDQATQGAARAQQNATARARALLPVLLAEAGNSKQARQAVLDWANAHGVGKARADALSAALGTTKAQFLAAAHDAGVGRDAALKLWAAYQKLPGSKNTTLRNNAAAQKKAIEDYQHKIDSLHGKRVDIYQVMHLTTVQAYRNQREAISGYRPRADGGIDRYADGGMRRDLEPFIAARPTVLFGETSTGGEAFIPLGARKRARSVMLLGDVARMFGLALVQPMADGGILSFANGGMAGDVSLSTILSTWAEAVNPSTKAQVDAAIRNRRTQLNQLAAAEDALAKARKRGSGRDIAAAERRIATERADLAAATSKLADVEARYRFSKQSPATQLGSALTLDIKNTAAFIRNLTTLNDRGFGALAQALLAMGDSQAEKIAADAVKFSSSKLKTLQGQVIQSQQEAQQLANLPAVLTARSAIKAGKGGSWVDLLNATGLTPDVLAVAVKSMLSDLNKTAAGRALVADMHAHGYARGGAVTGPPGIDRTLIRATAGEFMVNARSSARYRPWLEAINAGQLEGFVRRLVSGGSGGARPASAPAPVVAGPVINNTFNHQAMEPAEHARNVSREIAWQLS